MSSVTLYEVEGMDGTYEGWWPQAPDLRDHAGRVVRKGDFELPEGVEAVRTAFGEVRLVDGSGEMCLIGTEGGRPMLMTPEGSVELAEAAAGDRRRAMGVVVGLGERGIVADEPMQGNGQER